MSTDFESAVQDVTAHLTSERQVWLFGAGISCQSGIPLMFPLTDLLASHFAQVPEEEANLFLALRAQLPDDAHIEHVLSQLGDLIALADRSKDKSLRVGDHTYELEALKRLHGAIRDQIALVIRKGYVPAQGGAPARIAEDGEDVVHVEHHRRFVRTLYAARDKGGRQQRPVQFFTLNYDTLLEDALAIERVSCVDGFSGGGMAYWAPSTSYADTGTGGVAKAQICKLHGSVDWHGEEDGSVLRCRDGRAYPPRAGNVLIYPQSTKYVATQRDPFAPLFERFRVALSHSHANVLAVSGYSFGDEHVDLEIEAAMARPDSKTVIVAFSMERDVGGVPSLPPRLLDWITNKPWRSRIFVLSNRGLYHGSPTNLYQGAEALTWWTFQGLADFLGDGPQQVAAPLEVEVVPDIENAVEGAA